MEVIIVNVCMAHRGWSSIAPENTIAAIELALYEPRIQAIEIDVQLSKDGVPVVIHDHTLNRTTNGVGIVQAYTYNELQCLDAGSWFSNTYKGERIPSLEDVFRLVRGRSLLNIDIKGIGFNIKTIAEKIITLIDKYNMRDNVLLTSFNQHLVRYINQYSSYDNIIRTGLNLKTCPMFLVSRLKRTKVNVASMKYSCVNKSVIDTLNNNNYQLIIWTVNQTEQIESFMENYQNIIICTDYPQRMIPFMRN